MIEAISHLIHRDYEAIVQDFITLRFIPKGEAPGHPGLFLCGNSSVSATSPHGMLGLPAEVAGPVICRHRSEAHPACVGEGV